MHIRLPFQDLLLIKKTLMQYSKSQNLGSKFLYTPGEKSLYLFISYDTS